MEISQAPGAWGRQSIFHVLKGRRNVLMISVFRRPSRNEMICDGNRLLPGWLVFSILRTRLAEKNLQNPGAIPESPTDQVGKKLQFCSFDK